MLKDASLVFSTSVYLQTSDYDTVIDFRVDSHVELMSLKKLTVMLT